LLGDDPMISGRNPSGRRSWEVGVLMGVYRLSKRLVVAVVGELFGLRMSVGAAGRQASVALRTSSICSIHHHRTELR
jgi:hypothetical protein